MYNFWIIYGTGILATLAGPFVKQKKWMMGLAFLAIFLVMSSAVAPEHIWTDLNNYETSYNSATHYLELGLSNDWAFYNLAYLCKTLGFSFMQFKALLMLAVGWVTFSVCRQYSGKGIFLICFCLLLHQVVIYSFLLRNTVAFAIIFFAMPCLFDQEVRHGTAKYMAVVLIAAQFHSMSYLYLPFIFLKVNGNAWKKYRKLLFWCIMVIVVLGVFMVRSGFLISFLASIAGEMLNSDKYAYYAANVRGRYAWLVPVLIWILTILNSYIVWRMERQIEEKEEKVITIDTMSGKSIHVTECGRMIMLTLVISSLFIPLLLYGLHMVRYLAYMSILYTLHMSMAYAGFRNIRRKREERYTLFLTIIVSILWALFHIFLYAGPENVKGYFVMGKWFWQ